jgi:DNA-binding MurR/RpiR family transcriptional regulator
MLQPVEKLRQTFERGKVAPTPLTQGLEVTLANLRGTAQSLEPTLLAAIVKRVRRAPTVYVMGFGLSSHLAALLALDLQPFCRQLINVVEFGGTEVAAGRLMNIGTRDLLIVISFPRYAKDAIQLTDYARDRGATVVAVTDSPASPLAQQSDFVLIAQSTHPVLSSSSTAAVLVIEALATSLMVSHRANATQAAKLTEAISAYMFSGASPARASRRRASER